MAAVAVRLKCRRLSLQSCDLVRKCTIHPERTCAQGLNVPNLTHPCDAGAGWTAMFGGGDKVTWCELEMFDERCLSQQVRADESTRGRR